VPRDLDELMRRLAFAPPMIVVLINPHSGVAATHDRSAHVAQLFDAAGADARIVELRSATEAPDAARSAISQGAAAVVAGGGDGTVSSVASVLVGSTTPLGVLPLGTLNHFAGTGIPGDLAAAAVVGRAHRRSRRRVNGADLRQRS
jgi:diacylglycerol kinase family enzyme